MRFRKKIITAAVLCANLATAATIARADKITLKDGRIIEGKFTRLPSLLVDIRSHDSGDKPTSKLVVMADNELCRTYFPWRWVDALEPSPPGQRLEQIDVPQNVDNSGMRVGNVGPALEVTPFDQFGRRTYSMLMKQGRVDVIQGITRITPVWCKVEGLQVQGVPSLVWDMRMATSSIPRETLSQILNHLIDPKDADERMKVVRLYLQAERYQDAEAELNQIIQDFPDRQSLRDVARDIKQQGALKILKEIDVRREAGQHQLAFSMLQQFPAEGISGQILQQVRSKLDDYNQLQEQGQKINQELGEITAHLPNASLRTSVEPIVKEIRDELALCTMDRMATYRRFADDPQSTAEHRLALAISGWVAGAAEATENLQTALSLVELRKLAHAYLNEETKPKRNAIFAKMQAQEAMSMKLLAALVTHMKPPIDTAPQTLPGFYELTMPGIPGEQEVTYYVQLPPEYDPHASYPCIVALNGLFNSPQLEIDWWAGEWVKRDDRQSRYGQATRLGYIVIAPVWIKPHQLTYEGSAREHATVLGVLRDACRRFAIDSDRVFLSGHSLGGNAAWDIGLAHPDLWAGIIPITATAEQSVSTYRKNGEHLPMYFVCGELDGDKLQKNSADLEYYMNRQLAYDCTLVDYLGRGHENFSDEILRIFDWMGRKKRDFFPKEFSVYTQRSFDNFFWWVELHDFAPTRPVSVDASIGGNNSVNVKTGGKLTVWLSPEIVDFTRPISVTQGSTRLAPSNTIHPDPLVLLEDARTRADRKHPFWAKVE